MGEEVLSQAEVESLLSAMDTVGSTPKPAAPTSTAGPTADNAARSRTRDKITPYDFKRPERVGKDQMRSLQSLHEGFGRNFGASLSAMIRSMIEIKLTSVDQLTYSEFVFSLENPTCFNVLNAKPLEGNIILDFNPSILYPIIDRLLGGGKESSSSTRRPLTDIEMRLVSRITTLFLDELAEAWKNVLPLELSVDRVESNPQLVSIVPPNEVIVLISFELTLGDVRGMMNLCIPYNSIERFSSKLASNSWQSYRQVVPTDESRGKISKQLDRSLVEVVVTLAETKISTRDLFELRVGDIITTDQDQNSALQVEVEGTPKFKASPGSFKGQKAIEVTERVEPVE